MEPTRRALRLATRSISHEKTRIMAIVNATPDSFSDGGRFLDANADVRLDALEDAAAQLVRDGADMFDVGGESSRPGAEPVDESEELRRVIPVVRALKRRFNLPISVDTYRPAVADAALRNGAEIVNDIAAGRYISSENRFAEEDERHAEEMARLVAERRAAVVIMHMRGTPKTMQRELARYAGGVVEETIAFLRKRRDAFLANGVEIDRIAFDPGLGFGKSYEDNFALLRAAARFAELGGAVLFGHSRKSFLRETAARFDVARGVEPSVGLARLDALTSQASVSLARQGVGILRVHNAASTRLALDLARRDGTLEQ